MGLDLKNFKIDMPTKIASKKNVLDDAYQDCTSDEEPELIYIVAGPGAGKSSVERYFQNKLLETKGIIPFIFNSDKLATYHPKSDEALKTLVPSLYYKITRWFVRPATPVILEKMREARISLINERTLSHCDADVEETKKFKEAGYKVKANIIATDIFLSRLSCFEREVEQLKNGSNPRGIPKESHEKMYNSFEATIRKLDELGLLDEINVFTRGKTVLDDPILIYQKGNTKYKDFKEAIDAERKRQREILFNNSKQYFERIRRARETIAELAENEELKQNAVNGLDELEKEFIVELLKYKREEAMELIAGKNSIIGDAYDMVLTLSNKHGIEDGDDICDYIEEIDRKYGLTSNNNSEMGKLYAELENAVSKESKKNNAQDDKDGRDDGVSEVVNNSDEAIFENPDMTQEEAVQIAKGRIECYDRLTENLDHSIHFQLALLNKLKTVKKTFEDIEKSGRHIMHPTVEDFREEII